MANAEASQQVECTVSGVITRLVPCAIHATNATGKHIWRIDGVTSFDQASENVVIALADNAVCIANPNGYVHDCPKCRDTPNVEEQLEEVRTRHEW